MYLLDGEGIDSSWILIEPKYVTSGNTRASDPRYCIHCERVLKNLDGLLKHQESKSHRAEYETGSDSDSETMPDSDCYDYDDDDDE